MKITNFKDYKSKRIDTFTTIESATVDVTTFSFKRLKFITETREVFRDTTNWRWLETGGFTPGQVVENLAKAFIAKQRLKNE